MDHPPFPDFLMVEHDCIYPPRQNFIQVSGPGTRIKISSPSSLSNPSLRRSICSFRTMGQQGHHSTREVGMNEMLDFRATSTTLRTRVRARLHER